MRHSATARDECLAPFAEPPAPFGLADSDIRVARSRLEGPRLPPGPLCVVPTQVGRPENAILKKYHLERTYCNNLRRSEKANKNPEKRKKILVDPTLDPTLAYFPVPYNQA